MFPFQVIGLVAHENDRDTFSPCASLLPCQADLVPGAAVPDPRHSNREESPMTQLLARFLVFVSPVTLALDARAAEG